jgi:CBS domain containing-hemolysin-like protein
LETQFHFGQIALMMCLVAALVLLNAFFVAAEFSLVKVRQSRLTQLANEGNGKAKYALKVTRRLDTYLSATQLGITLASLGLGWVGEPAIAKLIVEPVLANFGFADAAWTHTVSFIVAFSVMTFLHIVLGELAPKSLAIRRTEGTSLWVSAPLVLFYRLFMPAIWLLNGAANRLLRLLGVRPVSEREAAHTEEEIRILMDQSAKSGHIDQDEMALFDNIFEFSERLAREVMVPRTDMVCLYTDWTFEENMKLVYEKKHTRFPVAAGDKDRIVGFVHITDLLTADPDEEHTIEQFLRPILMVPESMEISDVLRMMQKRRSHIAVVVDEYGGTAGLLTSEDILEEIVGELHDEFDLDERSSVEMNGNTASVDGRTLIEEINDMFQVDIKDDEVDSIGGWMFKELKTVPEVGSKLEHSGLIFEVTEVDRLRIVRLNIRRKDQSETATDSSG